MKVIWIVEYRHIRSANWRAVNFVHAHRSGARLLRDELKERHGPTFVYRVVQYAPTGRKG